MIRLLGILLAVAGVAVLAFGISVSCDLDSKAAEILHSPPAEHSLLLMIAGAGATAIGFALAASRRPRRTE